MPRIKRGPESPASPRRASGLVDELVRELSKEGGSGQPVIDEQHFSKTGKMRVTVFWDKWEDLPQEDRIGVILSAYERSEGIEARDNVVLASGLTYPEAVEAGMLLFQVIPLLRRGDPVSLEDCRRAMIEVGASTLFDPDKPELRFATEEAAKASISELIRQIPGSEPVWAVVREPGRIETFAEVE